MSMSAKLVLAGALLAAASGPALAHGGVQFGFSIGVPAPVYVPPPRVYYGYGYAPPAVVYSAPAWGYYRHAPRLSFRYEHRYPAYRMEHRRRWDHWRREHRRDDDDD